MIQPEQNIAYATTAELSWRVQFHDLIEPLKSNLIKDNLHQISTMRS